MIEGLNKETLKRLYIKEGKSTTTIARMFGCSPQAINTRCRNYGISLRPPLKIEPNGLNNRTLRMLYIKEQRSIPEIAGMFGCSFTAIRSRCIKYGIKLRPKKKRTIRTEKSVIQRLYVKERKSLRKIAEELGCSDGVIRSRCKQYGIKTRSPYRIEGLTKSVLQKLYVEEGKTTREIGKILGCSYETVRIRCKLFGIKLRQHRTITGE